MLAKGQTAGKWSNHSKKKIEELKELQVKSDDLKLIGKVCIRSHKQLLMLVYQNHSFFLPGDPVNRTCLLPLDAIFELQPLLLLQHRSAAKLKEDSPKDNNFSVFSKENRPHPFV